MDLGLIVTFQRLLPVMKDIGEMHKFPTSNPFYNNILESVEQYLELHKQWRNFQTLGSP